MNTQIINLLLGDNSLTLDLVNIINDIKQTLCDESLSDYDCIDSIVNILERYNINCQTRHPIT